MGLICPEDYALRPLSTNCQLGRLSAVLGTLCFFPQGLISLPTRPRAQAEPHTALTIEAGGAHAGHVSWRKNFLSQNILRAAPPEATAVDPASNCLSCYIFGWESQSEPQDALIQEPAADFNCSVHLLSLTHSCTHTCLLQCHHLEITTKQGLCLLWQKEPELLAGGSWVTLRKTICIFFQLVLLRHKRHEPCLVVISRWWHWRRQVCFWKRMFAILFLVLLEEGVY